VSELLDHAPGLSAAEAEAIASRRYGRKGRARALTSERDQNFLIEDEHGAIVLKIANALEERALLEAQQQVLALLARHGVPAPRVVCTANGESLTEVDGAGERRHFVWAVSHVAGVLLADVGHRTPELLEDLGTTIGQL
jgi:Ser/Thr protein kinase RdoA (MazF antagonist)